MGGRMTKVVLAAWLLMACSLALAKDPTALPLPKGARVGIVNLLDPEVTHFHNAKLLTQRFLKTHPVNWQVDSMLSDAVTQRLTQLGLVPVPMGPTDAILHSRDDMFVNNSVVKGLPRDGGTEFTALAASQKLDALIVLAPSLNSSAQAGGPTRHGLPDYLRGWGYVTGEANDKPPLFNMTQLLLIAVTPDGAVLRAREWGGTYTDEWVDYVAPDDPKRISLEELDKLQPLFGRILARQADALLAWIAVPGS
jgi:hypothetical protein